MMTSLLYPNGDMDWFPIYSPELSHIQDFIYLTASPKKKSAYWTDGDEKVYVKYPDEFIDQIGDFPQAREVKHFPDECRIEAEFGQGRTIVLEYNADVESRFAYYATRCDYVVGHGISKGPDGPSFLVAGIDGHKPFYNDVTRVVIYDYNDRDDLLLRDLEIDYLSFSHFVYRDGRMVKDDVPELGKNDFGATTYNDIEPPKDDTDSEDYLEGDEMWSSDDLWHAGVTTDEDDGR